MAKKLIIGVSVALLVSLASVASAQRVHEVRPAASDEVRIGAESNATMNDIVVLARRISDNPDLTVEDVFVNNPRLVRYVCRHRGRQVYFGADPEFGGRCPEGARRGPGVIRNAVYRIPRAHGTVLATPATPSVRSRNAGTELALTRNQVQDLTATVEGLRDEHLAAETERDEARRERDEARQALATARGRTRTVTVVGPPDPALGIEAQRLRGENARLTRELLAERARTTGVPWWWILIIVLVCSALAAFLYIPENRRNRRNWDRQQEAFWAEEVKPKLDQAAADADRVKNLRNKIGGLDTVLHDEQKLYVKLGVRLKLARAAGNRVIEWWRTAREKLNAFTTRQGRIKGAYEELMTLRSVEDDFDVQLIQIELAEEQIADADQRDDRVTRADCEVVMAECRSQITRLTELHGDPDDLRAKIAGLVGRLRDDFFHQCGISIEGRPALELKSEYEERLRKERARAEAARRLYEALSPAKEVRQRTELAQAREKEEEMNSLLGALAGDPEPHARVILARDARIADLEQHILEMGGDVPQAEHGQRVLIETMSEPPEPPSAYDGSWEGGNGSGTPAMGVDRAVVRQRIPTVVMSARGSRVSALPNPPTSPMHALNHAVFRFLETTQALPADARVLECNEHEMRDWLYLLEQWSVLIPTIKGFAQRKRQPIQLRKLASTIARAMPEWLSERLRRKTDPPPQGGLVPVGT